MTNYKLYLIALFLFALSACNRSETEDTSPEVIELISTKGENINMNGIWESGCVANHLGEFLKESITFSDNTFTIKIDQYQDSNCEVFSNVQNVNIEFEQSGTIPVDFNNKNLIANKIDGVQSIDGNSSKFKQTLLLYDQDSVLNLYHAQFGDDGGRTSVEGYPLDIIEIAFSRRK